MHVRDDPSNDKYRKIDTHSQGYIKVLKDKPGALDLLKAMNFTERNTSGKDLVLTRDRVDPALLYLGISALEQIRKTEEYMYHKRLIQFRRDVTQIMDGSNLNANVDQEQELIKRAHNLSVLLPRRGSSTMRKLFSSVSSHQLRNKSLKHICNFFFSFFSSTSYQSAFL